MPATAASAPVAPVCATCGGAGYVRSDAPLGAPTFGQAIPCACMRETLARRAVERIASASNLTPALRMVDFDTLERDRRSGRLDARAAQALRVLRAFAQEPEGWVLLQGKTGTNKTRLLAATANALLNGSAGYTCRALYVVAPDFLDYIRAGYDAGSGTISGNAESRIQEAINADVLLIDDLGAESASAWVDEKLYRIINARYNAGAPMVVATNTPAAQLEPRIRSRLNDWRLAQVLYLAGPDLRTTPPNRGYAAAEAWDTGEDGDAGAPWERGERGE